MDFMLPTANDNGVRLAAILPTGIAAVARSLDNTATEMVSERLAAPIPTSDRLPPLRAFVMVVVDGLGHANLQASRGHAPTLARLQRKRIGTVAPSTTGAALTTLTTGTLPGEHGLVGYRIRHPELGLVTTLNEWDGITDSAAWQRSAPLFQLATEIGARPVAIGRPAHATGGLTSAILRGAEYVPGQRIEDRFGAASRILRDREPAVIYLYVDELDKAAHASGAHSEPWLRRLEQLDGALADFLRTLPGGVGVAVTADHGIVNVPAEQQVMLDAEAELWRDVAAVGGEPRLRSLYLAPGVDADDSARRWADAERNRAWVTTRADAIASGWFGATSAAVAERLGDVLIAARKPVAYYSEQDSWQARAMIGQHGSFSDEERGVPLALAGALDGSGFAAAVGELAAARGQGVGP